MIKKKKLLLLLNNAPDVKIFTNDLYHKLNSEDIEVVIAAESLFYEYTLELNVPIKYVFSQYFKKEEVNNEHPLSFINNKIKKFNIWDSYFSDFDRAAYLNNVPSKKYAHNMLISLYNFFYEILEKEKIDIIWHEPVSNSFNHIAYNVSTLFNTKYLGIVPARLPNKYDVYNSIYGNSDRYIEEYNNCQHNFYSSILEKSYVEEYLHNFDRMQPDYMKSNGLNAADSLKTLYFRKNKIKYLWKSLLYVLKEKKNDLPYAYQIKSPLKSSFMTFWRQLKRRIKLPIIKKTFYDSSNNLLDDHFFLYPLHYHPESSTSIWAKHFTNELNTIINIAFNLPFGYKLYVKDHPSAAGLPPISFYRELSKIPNVSIIDYKVNTKNLIKKSKKVITLTSTVGFEALILGKSVIVLGNVFYDKHPLVTKINNFDNLFDYLSEDSLTFNIDILAENSIKTILAYYKMTISIDNYTNIVDLIVDIIKKQ